MGMMRISRAHNTLRPLHVLRTAKPCVESMFRVPAQAPQASQTLVSQRFIHVTVPRLTDSDNQKKNEAPKTLSERMQKMWMTVKYLFRFYLNGVKQIWYNRTRVREIKADVRRTKRDFSWEEMQLISTHSKDMIKLPIFLLILVTVEELLPLMVIYTPFMLPSTCILPSQRAKIRQRFEVKREKAMHSLQESAPTLTALKVPDGSVRAAINALPAPTLKNLTTYVCAIHLH